MKVGSWPQLGGIMGDSWLVRSHTHAGRHALTHVRTHALTHVRTHARTHTGANADDRRTDRRMDGWTGGQQDWLTSSARCTGDAPRKSGRRLGWMLTVPAGQSEGPVRRQ